jgi:hypothetical protein
LYGLVPLWGTFPTCLAGKGTLETCPTGRNFSTRSAVGGPL